jgi:hypothetical protein
VDVSKLGEDRDRFAVVEYRSWSVVQFVFGTCEVGAALLRQISLLLESTATESVDASLLPRCDGPCRQAASSRSRPGLAASRVERVVVGLTAKY